MKGWFPKSKNQNDYSSYFPLQYIDHHWQEDAHYKKNLQSGSVVSISILYRLPDIVYTIINSHSYLMAFSFLHASGTQSYSVLFSQYQEA